MVCVCFDFVVVLTGWDLLLLDLLLVVLRFTYGWCRFSDLWWFDLFGCWLLDWFAVVAIGITCGVSLVSWCLGILMALRMVG